MGLRTLTKQLEHHFQKRIKIYDCHNGFYNIALYDNGKAMERGKYNSVLSIKIVDNKIYKGVQI